MSSLLSLFHTSPNLTSRPNSLQVYSVVQKALLFFYLLHKLLASHISPPKSTFFLLISTIKMLSLPFLLLLPTYILILLLPFPFPTSSSSPFPNSSFHLHPLPDPDSVVLEVQRKLDSSRRRVLSSSSCFTGNPIDDCWRCSSSDWHTDRQRLADCAIGFGRGAVGGKGGPIYVVTSSADADPVNPVPGTLRHAAIQEGPLWIVFSSSMTIRLSEELLVNSFKTIDGRGAEVHIAGGACITLQYVSHVIIHNIHIHGCRPAGNANVRASPTHSGWRTKSDGDGVSLYGARDVWVDHCSISECADGLVDAIMGSTGITISNNYFSNHDDVMLMGHSDDYLPDSGMQVTIAFNRFGEGLVQRMPRCRRGYFHIVNNDYTYWEMYAIGGSANPTINSQGNRYTAPSDPNAKEVTKRVDAQEGDWDGWNWRSEGDVMVNGAFFVPSGDGLGVKYGKASSVDPKSASLVDQITQNAGVIGGPRDNGDGGGNSGVNYGGGVTTAAGGEGGSKGGGVGFGYLGMVFASGAELPPSHCYSSLFLAITLVIALFSLCVHPS